MELAIDVGNTLTKFGLGEKGKVIYSFEFSTDGTKKKDELILLLRSFFLSHHLSLLEESYSILSSVVPSLTSEYVLALEEVTQRTPVVVGPGLKTGLSLKVDNPKEVGSDLIAVSIGALNYAPNSCFVADFGTASKYIYLDKEGRFAGLSIAPGMDISAKVLSEKGAALPSFSYEVPPSALGKNTFDCLKSGLLYGTIYEALGFYHAFEKISGTNLIPILTGGNAPYLASLLPEWRYEKDLLLEGLFTILERKYSL